MPLRGAPQRYAPYPARRRRRECPLFPLSPVGVASAGSLAHPSAAMVAPLALETTVTRAEVDTMDVWSRLPLPLLAALNSVGVRALSDLAALPGEGVPAALRGGVFVPFFGVIAELRRPGGPESASLFRLLLREPGAGGKVHLHDLLASSLGVPAAAVRRAGPTPSSNIAMLHLARSSGLDPRPFCDAVADARAGAAVRDSTACTYDSHLLQVGRACEALGESPLPASLATIRRVTSVVGHPSTLRGWLAAWRRLHCRARVPWAGDRDPFLVAVRTGMRKALGPPPVRMRCRKDLLRKLLRLAARHARWEVGAFAVLCYTFGLRAPSELVRQATAASFSVATARVSYGPIQRKGQEHLQTLTRWCICSTDRLLCVHDWLDILIARHPRGPLFPDSAVKLMGGVVALLQEAGVPDAGKYTSHCFRRGAGVDVLEAGGLQAMLRFGQWRSPTSAEPYASSDEQAAQALGTALADLSEDDG